MHAALPRVAAQRHSHRDARSRSARAAHLARRLGPSVRRRRADRTAPCDVARRARILHPRPRRIRWRVRAPVAVLSRGVARRLARRGRLTQELKRSGLLSLSIERLASTAEETPTLPRALRYPALFALLVLALRALSRSTPAAPPPAPAQRTLDDYRHFRVTAIDLLGRMPTREELAAFERSDFDVDRWIDEQLTGPGYIERLTRIYMDVLRLEPNLLFQNASWELYRHDVQGPDGKPVTDLLPREPAPRAPGDRRRVLPEPGGDGRRHPRASAGPRPAREDAAGKGARPTAPKPVAAPAPGDDDGRRADGACRCLRPRRRGA